MEDNVPFFDMMSDPVPLLAQETRFGACASSLKQWKADTVIHTSNL